MKIKRSRIKLQSDTQENVPLFYNYIDIIKKRKSTKADYQLKQSELYGSSAIIEAPSKLVSSIIDFSIIKNNTP